MPVLLNGLEACPLCKSDCSSLDFVFSRFFMKLFKTNTIDVVNYCRMQFNFELPSAQRSRKFADKYRLCDNALCKSFLFRYYVPMMFFLLLQPFFSFFFVSNYCLI